MICRARAGLIGKPPRRYYKWPFSWAQAYGREFAKLVSVLIFMVGLFMIAITRRRQGLRDKLAGTRVVYNADLKQITAFGQEPPLKGRSLQRRVMGRADKRYNAACSSPDIPGSLLPKDCQPRR